MASAESARLVMMVVAMVKSREEKEEEPSVASARAPACWEISPSCVVCVHVHANTGDHVYGQAYAHIHYLVTIICC